MPEGSWVGLDVHARSVVAGVIDQGSGEVRSLRLPPGEATHARAGTPPYVDVVERLVCLRGVSTLTAFALTVDLGDWRRFRPQSLGPFFGLTPSEHSSGERRRQGGITKTGNSHLRRLLVEAAWHQRRPPRRSVTLERRRAGKPLAVQAQAEHSARRLHGRWHALETRGKPRTIVVVAVARELAGHCWAIATME